VDGFFAAVDFEVDPAAAGFLGDLVLDGVEEAGFALVSAED
jgi:hypothetical protein